MKKPIWLEPVCNECAQNPAQWLWFRSSLKIFRLAWKLEFVADSNVWKNMTIQSIIIIVNILNCLNTNKIVRILNAQYPFH